MSNTTTPLPRHPSQTPTAIAHVRVTVANVGTVRQGATVVQVYAHDPPYTGVVRYFRRLVAFAKTPMINPVRLQKTKSPFIISLTDVTASFVG